MAQCEAETLVDYVVRVDHGNWIVCKRMLSAQQSWFHSQQVSRHTVRESAIIEMRARNAAHLSN